MTMYGVFGSVADMEIDGVFVNGRTYSEAEVRAALETMKVLGPPASGPTARIKHVKTGGIYKVQALASVQVSKSPLGLHDGGGRPMRLIRDGDMLTVYYGEKSGLTHIRHPDEMNDGRFVRLELP